MQGRDGLGAGLCPGIGILRFPSCVLSCREPSGLGWALSVTSGLILCPPNPAVLPALAPGAAQARASLIIQGIILSWIVKLKGKA